MSNTVIEVSKENALEAFENSEGETKELLGNLLGKKNLALNIMERVKTYHNACSELNISPLGSDAFSHILNAKDRAKVAAYHELTVIVRALNEGWEPNFKKPEEIFMPMFGYRKSPVAGKLQFVFLQSDPLCNFSTSNGAQLSLKNKILSDYAGRQFIELYGSI